MQPEVLKSIVGPKLILGIPSEILFIWVVGVGIIGSSLLTLMIFDIPFGGISALAFHFYFLKKTEKNPYFLNEKKALRAHPFPENIHKTKGRYYSA